jgi:hypothetical protein
VITLNGNDYGLCLLDTNAASEMAKRPTVEFKHFISWALDGRVKHIPAFSLFTVLELRKRQDVYEKFLDLFDQFPCAILQSHEQLLEAEAASYPDPTGTDPLLLCFAGAVLTPPGGATLAGSLEGYLSTPEGRATERKWIGAAPSIVEGMTSLVANYPPARKTYTAVEIRDFIEWAGFSQIAMRAPEFAASTHERGEVLLIDAFPSIKMTAFTVFYKFYVDSQRRPAESDAFDVIISAPAPYVDAIITERHQAEVIRKTKQQDNFLENLRVFTVRDFRTGSPSD